MRPLIPAFSPEGEKEADGVDEACPLNQAFTPLGKKVSGRTDVGEEQRLIFNSFSPSGEKVRMRGRLGQKAGNLILSAGALH